MIPLLMSVLLSAPASDVATSVEKIEKGIATLERDKRVGTIRSFSQLLVQFKRSVSAAKADLSSDKSAKQKAAVAKVRSLQTQAELIHKTLERARHESLQKQWLEVRREIDAIAVHVGVKPRLADLDRASAPTSSTSKLDYDTEKLRDRVKRFQDSLKGTNDGNIRRIGNHANDVAFHVGRLIPLARRGSSKAKDMKAIWKQVWPELNAMVAGSKRYLPRDYQREAEAINEACKALHKRYPS